MKNINDMGVKEFTISKDRKMALKCCKRAIDNVCVWKGNPQTLPKSLSQLLIIIIIIIFIIIIINYYYYLPLAVFVVLSKLNA